MHIFMPEVSESEVYIHVQLNPEFSCVFQIGTILCHLAPDICMPGAHIQGMKLVAVPVKYLKFVIFGYFSSLLVQENIIQIMVMDVGNCSVWKY